MFVFIWYSLCSFGYYQEEANEFNDQADCNTKKKKKKEAAKASLGLIQEHQYGLWRK